MHGTDLNALLQKAFEKYGKTPAISFYRQGIMESRITYCELDTKAAEFSRFLCSFSLNKGDRIILLLEKSLTWVAAYLGVLRNGLVAVPLNPGFRPEELEYLVNDSGAALVLADPDQAEIVKTICPHTKVIPIRTQVPFEAQPFWKTMGREQDGLEIGAADPALMIYTSGTTGDPKGAVLTHENLGRDAANIVSVWELSANDVLCHALPLFHVHGLCFALHTALISGAHVIMTDRFSPDMIVSRLLSQLPGEKVSVFMAVPTMYMKLMDAIGSTNHDFSHLRLITSGSAPLLESTFKKIKQVFGREPVEREGMTETGMNFSNPLHGKKIAGSIGLPLPNVQVRVVDPDKKTDIAPGKIGEFWLKSPAVMKEYWNKPGQTEEAFEKGWFRTGDLGKVESNGYYFLTDRIKHIIISGGENVSAKEVETVINEIPGVLETAVAGIPDDVWGEKVVALVQVEDPGCLTEAEVIQVCRQRLHPYKCPKIIMFTSNLPKNTMGKVLKEQVKQVFLDVMG